MIQEVSGEKRHKSNNRKPFYEYSTQKLQYIPPAKSQGNFLRILQRSSENIFLEDIWKYKISRILHAQKF